MSLPPSLFELRRTGRSGGPRVCLLHLPDGQSAHARHAQTARRAILSQVSALVPSGKSPACFRASRLDEEGRYGQSSRNVRRDAVDAATSQDEWCCGERRRRVVLAPLGWCQVREMMILADDGD